MHFFFFFFVSGQIFWVAVLFCLNAWGLELCVVLGCLWILVVLSYVCSFHLQMRGNPVGYVWGLLWLRDFFEEAGISCSLVNFVCGGDHGSLFLYYSHWVRLIRCESLWGVVAFYNDCITHPEIIGFHIRFSISILLYFSLGFSVILPNPRVFSNGCDQVWQAVFYGPAK